MGVAGPMKNEEELYRRLGYFFVVFMFTTITDFTTLLASYQKARSCKRYKKNILRFGFFLETNLLRLQRELKTGSYMPSPYVFFTVNDPKFRKVAAPAFRDRTLQHSLVSQLEPLFEKQFIYDSYACRTDKGTHFGLSRIKNFLQAARSIHGREQEIYCLRMDIKKFFASVSWDVLLNLVFAKVTDPQTRHLIEKILTQHTCLDTHRRPVLPAPDVLCPRLRRGLPIGNLTSQLFANIYLNVLDHFVKEQLHIRWYVRYMDDFLIIHPDRQYLEKIKKTIESFLAAKLKLQLNKGKVIIANVKYGVPFVGYRVFYDHVLVRGSTLLRMRRKLNIRRKERKRGKITRREFQSSLASFRGHLKFANGHYLSQNLFRWERNNSV